MQAGKLRHRVTIERRTESSRTAQGTPVYTWAELATRYASVNKLSGREAERAKQIVAEAEFQIVMRHTDITTKDRLIFGSRTFHILDVKNTNEIDHELIILAKETV